MSLLFDIGILAYGCITMRQHVVYILDLSMTLTFDIYVGGGGLSLVSFTHSFYLVNKSDQFILDIIKPYC